MRIEQNGIIFDYDEVRHILPEDLNAVRLRLLGKNACYELDSSLAKIEILTDSASRVRVRVVTDKTYDVTYYLNILKAAVQNGAFRELDLALKLLELLKPNLERLEQEIQNLRFQFDLLRK